MQTHSVTETVSYLIYLNESLPQDNLQDVYQNEKTLKGVSKHDLYFRFMFLS